MLLDKGAAEVRRSPVTRPVSLPGIRMPSGFEDLHDLRNPSAAKVRVSVSETHNDERCDCIDEIKVLGEGEEVVLTHTCHDGRVDKLIVKIEKIGLPVEHGTVT